MGSGPPPRGAWSTDEADRCRNDKQPSICPRRRHQWVGIAGMTPLDVTPREDVERLVGRVAAIDVVSWLRGRAASSAAEVR